MDQVALETTLLSLWQRVLSLEKTVTDLKSQNIHPKPLTPSQPVFGKPTTLHPSELNPLTGLPNDTMHMNMQPHHARRNYRGLGDDTPRGKFHEWLSAEPGALDIGRGGTQPLPEFLPKGYKMDDTASSKLLDEVYDHRTTLGSCIPETPSLESKTNHLQGFSEAPVGCELTEVAAG